MFLNINNTMAILLKTASVRVSSIQIMQVRVQNKEKSVWKSRYDGDVSVHYSHLLRVLRYLCGTISHRLFFPRSSSLELQAYSDAIWASDPSDRCPLSAYCVFLGGSLIA